MENGESVDYGLLIGFLIMFMLTMFTSIHFYFHTKDIHMFYINEQLGEQNNRSYYYDINSTVFHDIIEGCNNTAGYNNVNTNFNCAVFSVNKVFKYKICEDVKKITIEELFSEGGDCDKWALFYEDLAIYYNYSYAPILIKTTDDYSYHRFSIIYDEYGYCKVDMTDVDCFEYGTPEDYDNEGFSFSLF